MHVPHYLITPTCGRLRYKRVNELRADTKGQNEEVGTIATLVWAASDDTRKNGLVVLPALRTAPRVLRDNRGSDMVGEGARRGAIFFGMADCGASLCWGRKKRRPPKRFRSRARRSRRWAAAEPSNEDAKPTAKTIWHGVEP